MKYRLAVIVPVYLAVFTCVYFASYLLRFEFRLPEAVLATLWASLPWVLAIKSIAGYGIGDWRRTFRYVTLSDLAVSVITAFAGAAAIYALDRLVFHGFSIPRSVLLIDCALTILVGGGLKSAFRIYHEELRPRLIPRQLERTLVYGADHDAIALFRNMGGKVARYEVAGFVSTRRNGQKSLLAGMPVYHTRSGWSRIARRSQANHLLVPANIPGRVVRSLVEDCRDAGLKLHIIPSVNELVEGRFNLRVRDVTISDLLRRDPVELDLRAIAGYLQDTCVLVTGGAGSIGSELCRQILQQKPHTLIVLDQSEFGVFQIGQEFDQLDTSGVDIRYIVADVTDSMSMQQVFADYEPQVVFHAAAYKHVPLMQDNPREAIRNNVFGTKTTAELADRYGVERFVLISTDKAVRPSNCMGATKLLAEKFVQALAGTSRTRFITVRFGNVLNSAGSVLPTFRRQIEAGGPITVTHPEMERFFMTIPEAVQLVLQAGAIGEGGDVMILEMGKPVKIVDLAKDMISLSGLRYPDDIDITFSGIRPGEKLSEELFYGSEDGAVQIHDKIFRAKRTPLTLAAVKPQLYELDAALNRNNSEASGVLSQIVESFVAAEEQQDTAIRKAA